MAAGEEGYHVHWQQPSSVIVGRFQHFLRKKSACLSAFEHNVWHKVHGYNSYNFDSYDQDDQYVLQSVGQEGLVTRSQLRYLRNKIYARMASNQNVEEQLDKYKSLIEAFINECELLVDEADSFQDRIMRTANAVKYSNISPWKHVSESGPIVKTYKPFSSESEADDLEYKAEIEEASDSVDTQHNYELGGQNFELSEPECLTVPNVPEDSPWDVVDHDELHENVVGRSGPELVDEILTRLTKLKFFSNAWGEPVVTNTELNQ